MKKLLFAVSLLMTSLVGCSHSDPTEVYSDLSETQIGDISYNFLNLTESYYNPDSYRVSFALTVKNYNVKSVAFSVLDGFLTRDVNGATYSVQMRNVAYDVSFESVIDLESELTYSYSFSATVPYSISSSKYTGSFLISVDGKKTNLKYHLYEMPDEYRPTITLEFIVDGVSVGTKKMLKGKPLGRTTWVSDDYVYGCAQWYPDKNYVYQLRYTEETLMKESTKIYGFKNTILDYYESDEHSLYYVRGLNFVPETGIVVIPRSYNGHTMERIGDWAFSTNNEGLETVYIPRSVIEIGVLNFTECHDLKRIYYEGEYGDWVRITNTWLNPLPDTVEVILGRYIKGL